jgi:hypothetical protein
MEGVYITICKNASYTVNVRDIIAVGTTPSPHYTTAEECAAGKFQGVRCDTLMAIHLSLLDEFMAHITYICSRPAHIFVGLQILEFK